MTKTKTGRERAESWVRRRVTIVTSDSTHTIHLLMTRMPIRLKERGIDFNTYEGPIKALWEKSQKEYPQAEGMDIVGVLVASTDSMLDGQINWVEQSKEEVVEAGSDRLRTKIG